MVWIIFIGALALLFGGIVWSIYNRLVKADNQVDEALSLIDVQLKKRFELIPNLVEAVKGYNAHEAQILENIARQRSNIPQGASDKAQMDGSITGALRSFRLQVEQYPDLLANTQFLKLMDTLTIVEDELAMARRYYNGTVRDLHNTMEVFPNVLFVGLSGVVKKTFYEIEASESESPEINLSE